MWETPFQSRVKAVTSHSSGLPFHAVNSYFFSIDKREKPELLLCLLLTPFICSYQGKQAKSSCSSHLIQNLSYWGWVGWWHIEHPPLDWSIAFREGCWTIWLWNKCFFFSPLLLGIFSKAVSIGLPMVLVSDASKGTVKENYLPRGKLI